MTKRGRPSELTPELKERFLSAIAAGSHYEPACAYAGIAYSTFREWMQRGIGTNRRRASNQEYADFAEAVQGAEAKGELSAIASIRGASKDDWRAAAWMLERRHSDRWASTQKVKVQVEQAVDAELNLLFGALADDDLISAEVKLRIIDIAEKLENRSAVSQNN